MRELVVTKVSYSGNYNQAEALIRQRYSKYATPVRFIRFRTGLE
jgi:hypothetical protein